jgi:lactoylglutathione lyase
MNVEQCGIILNVYHFDACVSFYKTVFGLNELFSKVDGDFRLTCLEFGSAYLMIETGGVASAEEKSVTQTATILRFNVADIHEAFDAIRAHDANARLIENDWGTIVRCTDPDGNPISIRESAGFVPS